MYLSCGHLIGLQRIQIKDFFWGGGGAGAGAGWAGTGVLGKERGGRGSQSNNSHITRIYIAINFHRDIPYSTF